MAATTAHRWLLRRNKLGREGHALISSLQVRYVERGWPIKRMRAELGVGRNWRDFSRRPTGLDLQLAVPSATFCTNACLR